MTGVIMLEKRKMLLYAISSILITICISGFGRMSYGIVMPFMRESLLLSYKQAGMLATATAFGYLIMVLLVGIMAAKWGSKRLVIIGLFLFSVGLVYLISSILITICISGFGRMSYGIVMPFMRESLLLSYKQAGMLATATAFGYLIMVLLVGIMAAKWGSKRLVIIGLFLLSVGLVYL